MEERLPDRASDAIAGKTAPALESAKEIVETELADDPKSTNRAVDTAIEYYCPPRLGVVHLLIWITLAAVLLKVMTALTSMSGPSGLVPDRIDVAHKAIWYLTSCIIAAALLGAFVIARDKFRGVAGRLQAGHWLVLVISSTWLAHCAANVARLLLQDRLACQDDPIWILVSVAIGVVTAIIYLLLAILSRVGDQWRLLMLGLAAVSLIGMMPRYDVGIVPHFPYRYYYEMLMLAGIVGLVFLLIIVAIDLGGRQRRDVFHWLGVATLIWGIVVNSMIWPVLARGAAMP